MNKKTNALQSLLKIVDTVLAIFRFLLFPPTLRSLDKIAVNQNQFRYWSLVNELCGHGPHFKLFRQLMRKAPRLLVYRLVIVPYLATSLIKQSIILSRHRYAKEAGYSPNQMMLQMMNCMFRNLGLRPIDYIIYALHLEENSAYASYTAENRQLSFLHELLYTKLPRDVYYKTAFAHLINNKINFYNYLCDNGFCAVPVIATFGQDIEWFQDKNIPAADLFVKPVNGTLSRGTAVISYSADSDKYLIDVCRALPKRFGVEYPTHELSRDELLTELSYIGKKLELILQPKLLCHSVLKSFTGADELATLRIITLKPDDSDVEILGAYIRMSFNNDGIDAIDAGGVAAELCLETGKIIGTMRKFYNTEIDVHPVTGKSFYELTIPYITNMVMDCATLHEKIADTSPITPPVIGFDVAVCDDGYYFVEGNSPCDLQFQKLTVPYWVDKRFSNCIRSHLRTITHLDKISLDPVLRMESVDQIVADS